MSLENNPGVPKVDAMTGLEIVHEDAPQQDWREPVWWQHTAGDDPTLLGNDPEATDNEDQPL